MSKKVKITMLTTVDNPYNPFDQYDNWLSYDTNNGYYTPELLARFTFTSSELSEDDYNAAIETAIDEILEHDMSKIYKKVVNYKDSPYEDYNQ